MFRACVKFENKSVKCTTVSYFSYMYHAVGKQLAFSSVKPSPSGTVPPVSEFTTPELVAVIVVPLCLLVMVLIVVIVLNSLLMWMR